jgi:rhodanese-related sulfurtransferase
MLGSKSKSIIKNVLSSLAPYSTFSDERLTEAENGVRVIELRKGEIFKLKCSASYDYLVVVNGRLDVILDGEIVSLLSASENNGKPYVLPRASESCTLVASESAIVCHLERALLDELVSWGEVLHMQKDKPANDVYWRMACLAFRGLPLQFAEQAFRRMHQIDVKAGHNIIEMGKKSDSFYILTSGTAEIWRPNLYDDSMQMTEILEEGSCIGYEPLITGKTPSKTIRMREDGRLLVLQRRDFQSLIQKQLIKSVNADLARAMIENGYHLLDVRCEEEHQELRIPNSILMPLQEISRRIGELDRNQRYIAYCHSGSRSQVAAMKFALHNIDVWSLDGGIRNWPFELNDNNVY